MSDIAPEAVQSSPEDRLVALLGGGPKQEPATPEPAAPADDLAVETPEVEAAPEGIEAATEEDAPQPEEAGEAFEELEHLGKTYEVPVSLKKAFEENRAMATRASQTAKQAETLLEHVNAQAQLIQAETQFSKFAESEMSEKARLEGVLAQYKKLDWYQMTPEQYAENRRNRDILAEQLQDVEKALGEKRDQYEGWRQQQRNEMLSKGAEYLQKVIPNYTSDTTRTRIAQEAVALGYTQREIAELADPRLVVALHKAAQWDALQAQKPAAQNKIAKAPAVVKPGASTSQNTSTAVREKALRARLKQTGNVNDAAALLMTRMR